MEYKNKLYCFSSDKNIEKFMRYTYMYSTLNYCTKLLTKSHKLSMKHCNLYSHSQKVHVHALYMYSTLYMYPCLTSISCTVTVESAFVHHTVFYCGVTTCTCNSLCNRNSSLYVQCTCRIRPFFIRRVLTPIHMYSLYKCCTCRCSFACIKLQSGNESIILKKSYVE